MPACEIKLFLFDLMFELFEQSDGANFAVFPSQTICAFQLFFLPPVQRKTVQPIPFLESKPIKFESRFVDPAGKHHKIAVALLQQFPPWQPSEESLHIS